jgi:hypothetical protein
MRLFSMCARRRRGELEGESGRDLVAQADDWMTEQRIKQPKRIAAMFAPGFSD